MLLVAQSITVSAMASTTSFLKTMNNGTVAPQYHVSTTCTITGSLVKILSTGGAIQFPRPLLKQAKFTKDVPNETVAASLALDAARAPVINHPGPIGGGVTSYVANIDAKSVYLSVTSGNIVTTETNSEASKKLLNFMKENCN